MPPGDMNTCQLWTGTSHFAWRSLPRGGQILMICAGMIGWSTGSHGKSPPALTPDFPVQVARRACPPSSDPRSPQQPVRNSEAGSTQAHEEVRSVSGFLVDVVRSDDQTAVAQAAQAVLGGQYVNDNSAPAASPILFVSPSMAGWIGVHDCAMQGSGRNPVQSGPQGTVCPPGDDCHHVPGVTAGCLETVRRECSSAWASCP